MHNVFIEISLIKSYHSVFREGPCEIM
jgi:hypothetical protein